MIFLVHFGWAKPVPVNPNRLKNPKKNMLWISAAGPLANMILALFSGILLRLIFATGAKPDQHSITGLLIFMVIMSLQINLALAIFNVLPIAPLDGSKILYGLLPSKHHRRVHSGPIDLAIRGVFQQYLCRNLRRRIMLFFLSSLLGNNLL
jgi:Zn-dependent protease